MQTASSSTSSSYHWKYDVFLSFRGEDTRKSFIDHLYATLYQKGLRVLKDDKEAKKGKLISPQLDHAIEESRSAVVVFSRNYASSTWCLDELAQIVHCKNITIFPVFYNVDPSVVRKQTGEFEKSFVKHKETFSEDIRKVRTWRNALTKVANHSGFHLNDGYETQFIQEILKEIFKLCFPKYTSVEGLVGIDSRLEKLKKFISLESHDVRMIGICGMGGIGKTTIARVAYDLISCEFEGSSFLANVREISEKSDLVSLQKMLLSRILDMKKDDINIDDVFDGICMIRSRLGCKKVLIVIDDVNHEKQLENLASKHDWFGMGSRIIITSRNKHLLTSHGVDGVYEAEELNDDEALQFFISKAFKKHQPSESFTELSKCVVKYARGLPLALKVLGCFLCGREVHIWEDALERLKEYGDKEILDILQISFDGLGDLEKKIFLDIACFFKGMDRYYVTRILNSCGFFPIVGINTLIDKSLINILDDDKLWMHDLLQQMGQQIVYKECPEEPGKRSRLWKEADIHRVLTEGTGIEKVEGMMLNFSTEEIHCCAKPFSKMINLRVLKLCNVQLSEDLDYISNNLRLLDWKGYPFKSLPRNLQLDKIIVLNLRQSRIEQMPQGIKFFNNLESIDFTDCEYLIKTLDFKSTPNLKEVRLIGCKMLREVHPSLLFHKKITILNMFGCTSLTTLPNQIHMESLERLLLCDCYKLEKFPEIEGIMDCLRHLDLQKTAIKVLPESIKRLSGLEEFSLAHCKNLESLPIAINGLESLDSFNLFGCSKVDNLPETLEHLMFLEKLRILIVGETTIRWPMVSLFLMKNLTELDFSGCKEPPSKSSSSVFFNTFRLPTLSDFFRSLQSLILSDCNMDEEAIPNDFFDSFSSLRTLDLSKNNFVSLTGSINHLSKLECLDLNYCKRLRSLPELPSNIESIIVDGCVALETTSNALRLCESKLVHFSCINCLKLICGNNLASSMHRESIKAAYHPQTMLVDAFTMVFPGSEIPKWIQHKSEASSIKIERPPNSYDNKMVGCAICFVFDFHEHHSRDEDEEMDITHLYCLPIGEKCETIHIGFDGYRGKTVSDHLCLINFPQRLLPDFVQLSFESKNPALVVKRCGIHPLYEKELKELKTNKSSSSSFGKSYELDEDFVGSKVDVDCDGSEDEPISKITTSPNFIYGESSSRSRVNEKEIEEYSDDEDEPPSKRLKEF